MRSNFNSLLVALAILDIGVVVTSIWDYSLVKMFRTNPVIYTYMFPHFWYPLKNIIMTWTIFLTMGLSTERYLAVCRPIFYRTLGKRLASLFISIMSENGNLESKEKKKILVQR